jgi:hypothetical protein
MASGCLSLQQMKTYEEVAGEAGFYIPKNLSI